LILLVILYRHGIYPRDPRELLRKKRKKREKIPGLTVIVI